MTDVIHNYDVLIVGGGSAARSAGTNTSLAATS
jgi:hypothetical protein